MAKSMPSQEYQLRAAVNQLVRDNAWHLHRAFETHGCSCSPLRDRLQEVCKRADSELQNFKASNPAHQEMELLGKHVMEIDQAEHPALNEEGRVAGAFFRVWLYDHLEVLDARVNGESLANQYARAWYDGWRPKKPL